MRNEHKKKANKRDVQLSIYGSISMPFIIPGAIVTHLGLRESHVILQWEIYIPR